jgi:hypothetical protein
MTSDRKRPNYLRRSVGVLLCTSPVLLLIGSLASYRTAWRHSSWVAMAIMLAAAFVGLLNGYLSFVRPVLYQRAHGDTNGLRHVSGAPMVGTLLVLVAGVLGFGSPVCALLGMLVMAIDTGGSIWLLWSTWGDSSFWD